MDGMKKKRKECGIEMKEIFKFLTICFAAIWLVGLCSYSSVLIGTLAHEVIHQQNSKYPSAIEINYDGNGVVKADYFHQQAHEWVYLNGWIVQFTLIFMSVVATIVLLNAKGG